MLTFLDANIIANIWYSGLVPLTLTLFSMLIMSIRAMTHDEDKYPCPADFRPERFLTHDGLLIDDRTHSAAFGFGKR